MSNYYTDLVIQPIELILAFGMDFPDGNILKFLTRYCIAKDLNDLNKAIYYCSHSKRAMANAEAFLFSLKLYCMVNHLGDLIPSTFTNLYACNSDGTKKIDIDDILTTLQAEMNKNSADKLIAMLNTISSESERKDHPCD